MHNFKSKQEEKMDAVTVVSKNMKPHIMLHSCKVSKKKSTPWIKAKNLWEVLIVQKNPCHILEKLWCAFEAR